MTRTKCLLLLIVFPLFACAYSLQHPTYSIVSSSVSRYSLNRLKAKIDESFQLPDNSRRSFLIFTAFVSFGSSPAIAIERAVGDAEKTCREQGNCLENFDIDGAVGWNWGGKDRCDAT